MNARMIVAATAALCLTASAATFAQSGLTTASAPQASVGSGPATASAPRAWSETTPQPPTTPLPRPTRAPVASTSDTDQQTPPPAQATMPLLSGRNRGQLLNVKVEFTITDQMGTKPPVKKTMTMVVADRESSRIRTNADYYVQLTKEKGGLDRRQAPLSVDVNPAIEGSKIRLDFSIEYTVDGDSGLEGVPPTKTNVSERLAAVLESGVPMVVAQSSDAVSDRKVTIEIKATIMK